MMTTKMQETMFMMMILLLCLFLQEIRGQGLIGGGGSCAAAAGGVGSTPKKMAFDEDTRNAYNRELAKELEERPVEDDSECEDMHQKCEKWAQDDECIANPNYMHTFCAKSCNTCRVLTERTESPPLQNNWDDASEMGVPQVLEAKDLGVQLGDLSTIIAKSKEYMAMNPWAIDLVDLCRNEEDLCAVWAHMGECESNPDYMKVHCGPMCQSCEFTTIEGRCPVDPNAKHAWEPGDLNKMFERLTTTEPYITKYNVTVVSSPPEGPWVITLDNVLSEEETEHLIELGAVEGYERSTDVGEMDKRGDVGKKWCMNDCPKNQTAMTVVERLSTITGIDQMHSEYLQLLRYEVGQHYGRHHDYIPFEKDRQQGVRILTVFLYLNDVEAGGGTNFPDLDLTIMPKRGRALIWPSVLDTEPNDVDSRTFHQALRVEAGVKYGANAWFHNRDFKTPNSNGCQ